MSILLVNYIICILFSVFYTGSFRFIPKDSSFISMLFMSIFNGFLYLAGFYFYRKNIEWNGVILSSTFMKLGIIVPTALSIFVFHEIPTVSQVLGLCLSILCIIFLQYRKDDSTISKPFFLVLLLLMGGGGDAMSKVFERVGNVNYQNDFLLYTFLFAGILCLFLMISSKEKIKKEDILFGVLIGIPNYYSARFLLLAIYYLPAIFVYPSYSILTILTVSVAGFLLFKEKLSKRQILSFVGIIISIFLLT